MSRRKDLIEFVDQAKRFKKMSAEIIAQGPSGPCVAFMTKAGIDLTALGIKTDNAILHDNSRISYYEESLRDGEKCKNKFDPIWKDTVKGIAFMKAFLNPDFHDVALWGPTVIRVQKIVLPTKYENQAALFLTYKTKHLSYPLLTSPLLPFLTQNNIDLPAQALVVIQCNLDNTASNTAYGNSVIETASRDEDFAPVWAAVLKLEKFLMALYKNNQKILRKFGVLVVSSQKKAAERKSSLLPTEGMKIAGVIIGSTVYNDSAAILYVQKGLKSSAPMIPIAAGEKYVVTKGGSVLRFKNMSATVTIKFRVTTS